MPSETEKRREELAKRISQSLEAGIIPWQKKGLPDAPVQSAISGRNYSGINALYIMERCAEQGYTDPRFITVSEANKHGLHVRKGEHGTVLEYWAQDRDGKVIPRGYSVFNAAQLNGRLPSEIKREGSLDKAAQMLKNAGIDIPPGSDMKAYRDAIKKVTVKNAEETGLSQAAQTPELLALRYSMASTMVMRELGVEVEHMEGAPMKSWAASIRRDPSQLAKAARDSALLAGAVLSDMTQSHNAELFQAQRERAEAQHGQELVSEVATLPRGSDANLLNADLSGAQEVILTAATQATQQVNSLRASATAREAGAASASMNKFAEAKNVARQHTGGKNVVLTSAQPGKAYSGRIIGVIGSGPDKSAVQLISDNHAILHDIRDISAKSITAGAELTLAADERGYSAVQARDLKADAAKNERSRESLRRAY